MWQLHGRRLELKRVSGLLPARLESIDQALEAQHLLDGLSEALYKMKMQLPPEVVRPLLDEWARILERPRHMKVVKAQREYEQQARLDEDRRQAQLQMHRDAARIAAEYEEARKKKGETQVRSDGPNRTAFKPQVPGPYPVSHGWRLLKSPRHR